MNHVYENDHCLTGILDGGPAVRLCAFPDGTGCKFKWHTTGGRNQFHRDEWNLPQPAGLN